MIQISADGQTLTLDAISWSALQTKIKQAEDINGFIIIREDYYDFNGSNIYALDTNGAKVWTAELHNKSDIFVGFDFDGSTLRCQTWNGFSCQIDINSGALVGKVFTK